MQPPAPHCTVRQFRQILFWPVQLVSPARGVAIRRHWESLQADQRGIWHEVDDEFTGDPRLFHERHYHEFVTFLPYVQQFLYGSELGKAGADAYGESPVRVFRRRDVARVRLFLERDGAPLDLDVAHVDLYFFYDLDIAILALEVHAAGLSLAQVHDVMFRLGRAYPAFWTPDGAPGNCAHRVQWLAADGAVLAESDYHDRDAYLRYVCENRAPRLSSHWEFLLRPMASHHVDHGGGVRLRLLEYYRMPLMAYLALDDPTALQRADFIRLAFVSAPQHPVDSWRCDSPEPAGGTMAGAWPDETDFEARYCHDRHWHGRAGRRAVRYMNCGHAMVVVGHAGSDYFTDPSTGVLGQFRHGLFLLGLIAHMQKAALLMLSDRLTIAIGRLDITDGRSVRLFRRSIRESLEIFLRFNHRYWFHEVTDQADGRRLFRLWCEHLGSDRLFAETRDEIQDMNHYLETGSTRRQTNTVVRLTVVTTFGLVGTVATGMLGMNLIAAADEPIATRIAMFLLVLVPSIALTLYTVSKSARLAEFLEVLADERVDARGKLAAFTGVWRRRPGPPEAPLGGIGPALDRVTPPATPRADPLGPSW